MRARRECPTGGGSRMPESSYDRAFSEDFPWKSLSVREKGLSLPRNGFPTPGNEKGMPCESATVPAAVSSGPLRVVCRGIPSHWSLGPGRRRSRNESEDLPCTIGCLLLRRKGETERVSVCAKRRACGEPHLLIPSFSCFPGCGQNPSDGLLRVYESLSAESLSSRPEAE